MRSTHAIAGLTSLLATAAVAATPPARTDPFAGTWTLDVARSVIVDDMVVEAAGPNRFTFRFEGGPPETVTADGTEQPGVQGTTLAVKTLGPRRLTVVRRQDGKVIVSAAWTLAADGRTLRDDFTQAQTEGAGRTTHYLYKRMSGTSGWTGDWQSTTPPVGLKLELQITPEAHGLSIFSQGAVKTLVFDGQDHPVPGAQGAMRAAHRANARAFDYTDKAAGKAVITRALKLSPDGRTLTMTVRPAGQATPNVFVFVRSS